MNDWLFSTVPLQPWCETLFFFGRSAPVSNSNSHCSLLLSFKVCGLEKEKEESEVPKVESILKEPRRESRCERG